MNKNLALTGLNFKFTVSKLSQKMKKLLTVVLMLLPIMALAQNRPQDWAQFGRYSEANSALSEKPLAVLYGDSITDSWPKTHPDFFKENNLAAAA